MEDRGGVLPPGETAGEHGRRGGAHLRRRRRGAAASARSRQAVPAEEETRGGRGVPGGGAREAPRHAVPRNEEGRGRGVGLDESLGEGGHRCRDGKARFGTGRPPRRQRRRGGGGSAIRRQSSDDLGRGEGRSEGVLEVRARPPIVDVPGVILDDERFSPAVSSLDALGGGGNLVGPVGALVGPARVPLEVAATSPPRPGAVAVEPATILGPPRRPNPVRRGGPGGRLGVHGVAAPPQSVLEGAVEPLEADPHHGRLGVHPRPSPAGGRTLAEGGAARGGLDVGGRGRGGRGPVDRRAVLAALPLRLLDAADLLPVDDGGRHELLEFLPRRGLAHAPRASAGAGGGTRSRAFAGSGAAKVVGGGPECRRLLVNGVVFLFFRRPRARRSAIGGGGGRDDRRQLRRCRRRRGGQGLRGARDAPHTSPGGLVEVAGGRRGGSRSRSRGGGIVSLAVRRADTKFLRRHRRVAEGGVRFVHPLQLLHVALVEAVE
mmetsp:Transcript_24658/g.72114  ORF Transcript_24658/g.72114 Transcript_24658/m.72114 type:complete len:490 (-) Transcript_24658:599-2068(-)